MGRTAYSPTFVFIRCLSRLSPRVMMAWLPTLFALAGARAQCVSERKVDAESWRALGAGESIPGDRDHERSSLTRVECWQTNARCSDAEPLYVPRYSDAGSAWRFVFGHPPNVAMPSVTCHYQPALEAV